MRWAWAERAEAQGPKLMESCPQLCLLVSSLEAFVPQQFREPTCRRFLDSPPDSLLFLAIGGLYGADVLGEQRIRWVMYIFSPIRVVLPSLGLEFLLAELSTVSFCPFRSFSTIACVCGERVLVLSEVHVVLNGDIFCGALNIDGFAIDFIFCIDVWFPCVSLGAVAAHGSKYSARFVN